ncbi:hypothetical protein Tco_0359608 [Tanacetum coccineum]
MDDDLFTYEVKISELSYSPSVEQHMDDLDNGNLDLYERNLYYDECEKMYAKAFSTWLALKFNNHVTMGWYTKNALWLYWKRGDDEEVLTDKELPDLEETYINKEDEIAEIFRIKTNIFDFETPLCKAFNEFNYLLKIDTNLLTHDIPGFKTYEEYKNAWIYEWNDKWPTYNSNDDGYCDGGDLLGIIQNEDMVYFQDYEWYEGLEDGELKDKALMKKGEFEESQGPCSFNADHIGKSNEEAKKEEREPMNDYGIGNSDDHLASNNEPKHANEEEEQYNEERCELVRNPCKILPTCKIERFEVIKYSFGLAE